MEADVADELAPSGDNSDFELWRSQRHDGNSHLIAGLENREEDQLAKEYIGATSEFSNMELLFECLDRFVAA